MRLVLDTGVFFRPQALEAAMQHDGDLVVPAVAYAERLRQVAGQGQRHVDALRQRVRKFVEAFDADVAEIRMPALTGLDRRTWHRLARDAFIASHVRPGDELWTTDPQDFMALGLAAEQIVAV